MSAPMWIIWVILVFGPTVGILGYCWVLASAADRHADQRIRGTKGDPNHTSSDS